MILLCFKQTAQRGQQGRHVTGQGVDVHAMQRTYPVERLSDTGRFGQVLAAQPLDELNRLFNQRRIGRWQYRLHDRHFAGESGVVQMVVQAPAPQGVG